MKAKKAILKRLKELRLEKKKSKKKTVIIQGLVTEFSLEIFLR